MIAGQLEIQLLANMARLRDDMKQARGEVRTSMGQIENSVESAKKVLGTLGVGLSVGLLVNQFKNVVVESEKMRGSLLTVTGSVENAEIAFGALTNIASRTPFTLDQSVNGFIKLKALGLDPSERALLSYGNTASAMGKDLNQMIEAVADASTGEFERLKEFGIKAKSEGDNVSLTFQGVTTTIGKNSEEIQEYLLAIGETQFADAMANQMDRLPGKLSNLQDNVDALFRELGDQGGINLFGEGIDFLSGLVVGITENIDDWVAAIDISKQGFGFWRDDISAGIEFIDGHFETFFGNVNTGGLNVAEVLSLTISTTLINIKSLVQVAAVEAGAALDKLQLEINRFRLKDAQDTYRFLSGLGLRNSAWAKAQLEIFEELSGQGGAQGYAEALAGIDSAREGAIAEILQSNNEARNSTYELIAAAGEARGEFEEFTLDAIAGSNAVEDLGEAIGGLTDKEEEFIAKLEAKIKGLSMSSREQAINNDLVKLGAGASEEAIQRVIELSGAYFDQTTALEGLISEEEIQANMVENLQREWANLIDTFIDGESDIGDFFDTFVKGLKRVVAEAAAADLVSLIFGNGSGGNLSATLNAGLGLFGLGGGNSGPGGINLGSVGGLAGAASSLGLFGGGSALPAAGAGAEAWGAFYGGTGGATGGLGGALGKIGSMLNNPVGWAIGAALVGKFVHDATNDPDGFHRGISGFLGAPTSGIPVGSTFSVSPFASGFRPTGIADGPVSIADANARIDQFRFIDQTVFDLVSKAGGSLDLSRATLGGFGVDGVGPGTLFGGSQRTTDAQIQVQIDSFARQLGAHITGLTPDAMARVAGADSAQDLIDVLGELTDAQESSVEAGSTLANVIDHLDGATDLLFNRNGDLIDSNGRLIASQKWIGDTMQNLPGELSSAISAYEQRQRNLADLEAQKAAQQAVEQVRSLGPSTRFNPNTPTIPTSLEEALASGADLAGSHYVNGILANPGDFTFEATQRQSRVQRNLDRVAAGYNPVTGRYEVQAPGVSKSDQSLLGTGLSGSQEIMTVLLNIDANTHATKKKLETIDSDGLEIRTP